MKKWVSRVGIGVGIALVVLGVVLLVMGWMWPFSAIWERTVDYGTKRPAELWGVRRTWSTKLWVLPWRFVFGGESARRGGLEIDPTQQEDRVRDLWPGQWQSPDRVKWIRSYPLKWRFDGIDNWFLGPLFFVREETTVLSATNMTSVSMGVPTWALPLVGSAIAWSPMRSAWTLRQRRRRGLCLSCGYELKGLATCPECGKAGVSAEA